MNEEKNNIAECRNWINQELKFLQERALNSLSFIKYKNYLFKFEL